MNGSSKSIAILPAARRLGETLRRSVTWRPGTVRRTASASAYIVGPVYDNLLFIFQPLIALFVGVGVAFVPGRDEEIGGRVLHHVGYHGSPVDMFIGTLIMAHLGAVFFRSHGNPAIFRTHPVRFTLVPLLLLVAVLSSSWVFVCVSVVATWWDVYHSGLQTFGLGRIYDARAGNDPRVGRRLDMALNHFLYAGPVLAGAALMDHVEDFDEFEDVGATLFTAIPAQVEGITSQITWGVLVLGLAFLAFYLCAYARFVRRGYRVSIQKALLLVITAGVSIFTWGFNTFGEAFFIMNFFHAVQYFGIVWATEKKSMQSLFRLEGRPLGRPLTLLLFLGCAALFGIWAEITPGGDQSVALINVVALMHFWYDGFIWSVRQRQV